MSVFGYVNVGMKGNLKDVFYKNPEPGGSGLVTYQHPRGFSFFVGSDHCIGKLSKQNIPLRSSYDFAMGISFPFGKSHIEKSKTKRLIPLKFPQPQLM